MDFIEQLPPSSGYTAILVVVDRLSKQVIFIPTTDTVTSADLAQLFVLHVFSKHGVPSHVTSDRGSEFVSRFFRSLGQAVTRRTSHGPFGHPRSVTPLDLLSHSGSCHPPRSISLCRVILHVSDCIYRCILFPLICLRIRSPISYPSPHPQPPSPIRLRIRYITTCLNLYSSDPFRTTPAVFVYKLSYFVLCTSVRIST